MASIRSARSSGPLATWLVGLVWSIGAGSCAHGSSAVSTTEKDSPAPGPGAADATGAASGAASTPGGAAATDDDDAPAPVPYVDFAVNHVISTGQSNSVAHGGVPPLTTTQPFSNRMFDVGVMTSGTCEAQGCRVYQRPTSFVPLVEGDSFWYPVETMSSGLGNEAAMLAQTRYGRSSHVVLVSLAGRNGLTYWCLRKGGCSYTDPTYVNACAESLMQVRDGKALAAARHESYVVRMVTAIHGESDDFGYAMGHPEFPLDGSDGAFHALADYGDALVEWQRDYEAGVRAITGQSEPVPLLVAQFSGWNDVPTSAVTQFQLEAHLKAPGKVVLVTPGYPLSFAVDCRHYDSNGERRLGEYFGKAYARIVLEGLPWEPVRPKKITHDGSLVTAKFTVPVPPLVLDTQLVTNPGNYGFDAVDGAGAPIPVTSVALAGPDTVTVTLARAPGAGARLRYAFVGMPHTCIGPTVGPRGNVRDSDATPSNYGYSLYDWAVHFSLPIE